MSAAAAAGQVPPAPAGSSFYLGLRILPPRQRRAMYAIYGFCRAVDDIADGSEPRDVRLARLDEWQAAIAALYGSVPPPRHLAALHQAIGAFGLARADFEAILDGMRTDAAADATPPDWAALELYCDRVAAAPGRMSVRVFGVSADDGALLAHHLGRALQLTNILRDVDEDAGMGRIYLPREALADAGITDHAAPAVLADPRLTAACRPIAAVAATHFDGADAVMDRQPRHAVRAPRLMAAAYRPVLARLLARGWTPPRRRVRKDKLALVAAALRYGLF